MKRTPVESSNIAAIGYDEEGKTMEVEFHNGTVYSYHPITPEGHRALIQADSVGRYFAEHIKGNDRINFEKLP